MNFTAWIVFCQMVVNGVFDLTSVNVFDRLSNCSNIAVRFAVNE